MQRLVRLAWSMLVDATPSRKTSPRMTSMRSGSPSRRRASITSSISWSFCAIIGWPGGYVPVSRRRLARPLRIRPADRMVQWAPASSSRAKLPSLQRHLHEARFPESEAQRLERLQHVVEPVHAWPGRRARSAASASLRVLEHELARSPAARAAAPPSAPAGSATAPLRRRRGDRRCPSRI